MPSNTIRATMPSQNSNNPVQEAMLNSRQDTVAINKAITITLIKVNHIIHRRIIPIIKATRLLALSIIMKVLRLSTNRQEVVLVDTISIKIRTKVDRKEITVVDFLGTNLVVIMTIRAVITAIRVVSMTIRVVITETKVENMTIGVASMITRVVLMETKNMITVVASMTTRVVSMVTKVVDIIRVITITQTTTVVPLTIILEDIISQNNNTFQKMSKK
jgi:hypothetical protein